MSLKVNVYLKGFLLSGFGTLPPKSGSTGFGPGLGFGLGGIGSGLTVGVGCGIGLGAGFGFGAGGRGLGILVLMYQAWLRPLWQFQKMTCLLCLLTPP